MFFNKHFELLFQISFSFTTVSLFTAMETGLNAGMDTVGVLWGFRDREELEGCHPQYIVAHPSEVAEIVKKKNESHGRME